MSTILAFEIARDNNWINDFRITEESDDHIKISICPIVPVDHIILELNVVSEVEFITPPNEELLKLAEKHPAPQEWYDEDEYDSE